MDHHWGSCEQLLVTRVKATVYMTFAYDNLRLRGSGTFSSACKNQRSEATNRTSYSSSVSLVRQPGNRAILATNRLQIHSLRIMSKIFGSQKPTLVHPHRTLWPFPKNFARALDSSAARARPWPCSTKSSTRYVNARKAIFWLFRKTTYVCVS